MKEAVFPFVKFPGADTLLGPEMKSTGEVMGIDSDFGRAYAKAQIQAGNSLPERGSVLVSVREEDRAAIGAAVRELADARLPRAGDARHRARARPPSACAPRSCRRSGAPRAGERDTVGAHPGGRRRPRDQHRRQRSGGGARLRVAAAQRAAARGAVLHDGRGACARRVGAIRALRKGSIGVRSLQEIHGV